MKRNPLLLLLLSLCVACGSSTKDQKLTIADAKFVDGLGREVILNGINHVNKNVEQKHIDPNDKEILMQMRDWGFNIVRYGINWGELEPQPGVINEEYLAQIDQRVKWAEELGIWLYLDFHQDLYGDMFGNGAPQWATITDGKEHITGDIWSDAYVLSGAVHHSFDNFWKNSVASDSVGLQDHYLSCLKEVAERYKNSPSVAGYDIMNEPFMGSASVEVTPYLMGGYAAGLKKYKGQDIKLEEIATVWATEEGKMQFLENLNDKGIYAEMVAAADSVVNQFETGALSDFYQKARDVIRSTGSDQIIFLEHNYFCNLGVRSRFKMPVGSDGKQDPLCCYAPHGYDLVTDSNNNTMQGRGRVEFIFQQIRDNGVEKKSPVIVGEWGAYYSGDSAFTAASEHTIGIMEPNKFSQTYWAYWNGIGEHEYFAKTISRNYPMATVGSLISYNNNFEDGTYTQKWSEPNHGSEVKTRVFVKNLDKCKISISPSSKFDEVKIEKTANGYIDIYSIGGERELIITESEY